ncbi:MAG: hypothetical protein JWN98_806 [Abditibacteriota bacterium]|nr:hypothetical protein [Abditibacteriota bacterium]
MNAAKTGFAILCLVALIAVAIGALLEIARARRAGAAGTAGAEGATLVGRNQFWLRMLSAVVWMIVLGSLAYATLFLWPAPGDDVTARRFVAVVSGSILLVLIGVLLLAYDMWLVSRQRRLQEKHFERQLNAMAQLEIERLAAHHPAVPADKPRNSSPPLDSSSP